MKFTVSAVIDRPVAVVWQFVAIDHVRNHPRWDLKMELRQMTDGPIGVGTLIERRHARADPPITGTIQVVEFDHERAMGAIIEEQTPTGRLEARSRMVVEPTLDGRTAVTILLEFSGEDSWMDASIVEASLTRIKELIESEPIGVAVADELKEEERVEAPLVA